MRRDTVDNLVKEVQQLKEIINNLQPGKKEKSLPKVDLQPIHDRIDSLENQILNDSVVKDILKRLTDIEKEVEKIKKSKE